MATSADPTLSVIVAVFDGGPALEVQLEGLTNQRGAPSFEVVLSDNGSTDDSMERARRFDDRLELRFVDASAQRGQTFARNAGAAAARGEGLVFLDQDDLAGPGYLAALGAALERHQFVAARMDAELLNAGWVADVRTLAQVSALPIDPVPWGYGCTLGIRRARFEELGGFDTTLYVAAEDIDLCIRAAAAGIELVYVPEAVLHYRFQTRYRSLFKQGRRYAIGQAAVDRRHGLRPPAGRSWLRAAAGAAWLYVRASDRGQRGRASFLLGRRYGQIEGLARHRRPGPARPPVR